jgi:hypothetical protein
MCVFLILLHVSSERVLILLLYTSSSYYTYVLMLQVAWKTCANVRRAPTSISTRTNSPKSSDLSAHPPARSLQHTFCQCCTKKFSALSAHPPGSLQRTCFQCCIKTCQPFAKTDSGNKIPDTGVPQQDALPPTLRVLGYVHSATRSSRHQRRHLPPRCAVQHFHLHH